MIKKYLSYKIIISIAILYLFLFSNKNLYGQNSSAYNDVRNVTGKECDFIETDIEIATTDSSNKVEPCYKSRYSSTSFLCDVGEFKFDPFTSKDIMWNSGNEACLAYMTTTGIFLQGVFMTTRAICNPVAAAVPSGNTAQDILTPLTKSKTDEMYETFSRANQGASTPAVSAGMGAIIDPFIIIDLMSFGYYCAVRSLAMDYSCCQAGAVALSTYVSALSALAIIYDIAKKSFENYKICGENYRIWVPDASEDGRYKKTDSDYVKCLKSAYGNDNTFTQDPAQKTADVTRDMLVFRNYYTFLLTNSNCSKVPQPSLVNSSYREFLFKGIEVTDNGSGACKNPDWKDSLEILGYSGGNQKYYYRGSGLVPNYACDRFLSKGYNDDEGYKAFLCCNERSQNTICIEGKLGYYIFCSKINGECKTNGSASEIPTIKFSVFESALQPNYLCAKTYTVCPYDHNVGGGTDVADYYPRNPKIITNFCQYMKHCIEKPPISKINFFDSDTFFLAESCSNLVGDSQLIFNLSNLQFSPIKSRNFSAPIVQCLKESLENNFFQIAGTTICNDKKEKPKDGSCRSGVVQVKGQKMGNTIFQKLQANFQYIVKLAMVLAVVIFGFQILLASPEMFINKKTVMLFLIKFALVSFFVLGNAWQGFFVNYILKISSELSEITFLPQSSMRGGSNDGCVFPKFNHEKLKTARAEGWSKVSNIDTSPSYPSGKEYLRIWDTLDCKISRAIGYGPEVNTSNLAKMIFSGFISGPLGITFFFAAFAYGFLLISIVLRAIQITIMSLLGVILLIYVSPFTITCVLFERTKGIFENWWKQLLGFILQPMILFAYLGLLLTVFDNAFIGDARFTRAVNLSSMPQIDCSDYTIGLKTIKPDETSVYCILNLGKYKNFTGLEVFDLALPVLTELNKEKVGTLFKAAILMFVFFTFLDKITFVAKKLVGGVELKADMGGDVQDKLKKLTKAVGTRAVNATARLATKQAPALAKRAVGALSSGKSASAKEDSSKGADSVGSSSADNKTESSSDSVGSSNNSSSGSSDSGGGSSQP